MVSNTEDANIENSPTMIEKPECDSTDTINVTSNLKLNPVQLLFEKMKQPVGDDVETSAASLFPTNSLAINPVSLQKGRKHRKKVPTKPRVTKQSVKVPKNEPEVPVDDGKPVISLTFGKRTSPRFKQSNIEEKSGPKTEKQKKRSSSRIKKNLLQIKDEPDGVTTRKAKWKINNIPKKLTRAQFRYIMELTSKKKRTKPRIKQEKNLKQKKAEKKTWSSKKKKPIKANGTQLKVDEMLKLPNKVEKPKQAKIDIVENIKSEWEDDLHEEDTSNAKTSVSPKNKPTNTSKTHENQQIVDNKENSKNNKIVHPPGFTEKRKYTRKTSKTNTLFDNLKENTKDILPVEKPKNETNSNNESNNFIPQDNDDDDDDSDAASTAEWMPEDYAEYKFKYSVKKLSNYQPIHKCKICLLILPSYYKLNKHLKIHLTQDNPYVCNQCSEAFSVVEDLAAHIRAVHQGKHPYQCKKCNKGFWSKKHLETHMPVHVLRKTKQPNKRFKCDRCGKEFGKLCDMERHTRVHTGEKPCICNICQKRFQQAHNLSKHLLTHLHVKPFHCEICNKQFGRNDVLNRHLLTHSIEKPFKCSTCSKGFIRESQLTHHMNKQHPGDVKNVLVDC